MPWEVKFNQTLNIVEVVFAGRINAQDLHEATSRSIVLGKECATNRFLADTQDMDFIAQLADIYDLPDKQYIDEQADRLLRVAVIRPKSPNSQRAVQFYETVCLNRGWTAKAVSTREEAIDWLVGGNPAPG